MMRILALALPIALASCSEDPAPAQTKALPEVVAVTPSAKFELNEADLAQQKAAAKTNDVEAIRRLAQYYQLTLGDSVQAEYWLKRGSDLGDLSMRESYAYLIAENGNCLGAESLLQSVVTRQRDSTRVRGVERQIAAIRQQRADGACNGSASREIGRPNL